jgi:hypothetical protein
MNLMALKMEQLVWKALWCFDDRFTIRNKYKIDCRKTTFGIAIEPINEGSKANITLFNPEPKVLYENIYFIQIKKTPRSWKQK